MIKAPSHIAPKAALLGLAMLLLSGCDQGAPIDVHQKGLPQPLSQAEPLTSLAAGGCATGGLRLYHGLDYNGDGKLGIYERHRQELICNPTPLAVTPATGVALSKPKAITPEGS
jgi:hypothetical protein